MIDELRAWRADPGNEVFLQQLEGACHRTGHHLPKDALLATPRWRWLRDHTLTFYEAPLTAEDGESWEAIEAAEARFGRPLPRILTEWHALVGRRLETISARLTTLSELGKDTVVGVERLLSGERQGGWSARIEPGADDPPVRLSLGASSSPPWVISSLSRWLRGMTLSETVESVTNIHDAFGAGPLGALRPELQRGLDPIDAAEALRTLPELPAGPWRVSSLRGTLRGNRQLIVDAQPGQLAWVATAEGARQLGALVELREDPWSILELRFQASPTTLSALGQLLRPLLRELDASPSREDRSDDESPIYWVIRTAEPTLDVERLRANLSPHPKLLACLRARARPINRGRWREL